MFSERELSYSDQSGFAQDGLLLSWEPLSPRQIADLLDMLEDEEEGK